MKHTLNETNKKVMKEAKKTRKPLEKLNPGYFDDEFLEYWRSESILITSMLVPTTGRSSGIHIV